MERILTTDFGASGNGLTDDTGAFYSALNTIPAHGGGTLALPAGTYSVNNPIGVYSPSAGPISPRITGESRRQSTILLRNRGAPAFKVGGGVGHHPVEDMLMDNIRVMYADPPLADVPMFLLRNVKGFMMRWTRLTYYRVMMTIGQSVDGLAASCEDIHLEGVKGDAAGESFTGGEPDAKELMRIENVNGLWIDRCNLSGRSRQHGLRFLGQNGVTIDTVQVSNTLIKDCATGVRAGEGTASNVNFNNSLFDKCASACTQLEAAPGAALLRWQFNNCWYMSNDWLNVVAGNEPGRGYVEVDYNYGVQEPRPSGHWAPWLVAGAPVLRRRGI